MDLATRSVDYPSPKGAFSSFSRSKRLLTFPPLSFCSQHSLLLDRPSSSTPSARRRRLRQVQCPSPRSRLLPNTPRPPWQLLPTLSDFLSAAVEDLRVGYGEQRIRTSVAVYLVSNGQSQRIASEQDWGLAWCQLVWPSGNNAEVCLVCPCVSLSPSPALEDERRLIRFFFPRFADCRCLPTCAAAPLRASVAGLGISIGGSTIGRCCSGRREMGSCASRLLVARRRSPMTRRAVVPDLTTPSKRAVSCSLGYAVLERKRT